MTPAGLSLIIPAHNEAVLLKSLIKTIVFTFLDFDIPYEIIIVDDYSTDETKRIVKALAKHYPLRYIKNTGKRGKGYAVIAGFASAVYEYVGLIDADAEPAVEFLPRLFELAKSHGFACARLGQISSFNYRRVLNPHEGPEIFRREIFAYLNESLVNSWHIEAPLIHTARELGYQGSTLHLGYTHLRRKKSAKDNFYRFAGNLKGYVKRSLAHGIHPFRGENGGVVGAGVAHRGNRFVTHSTLPSELSALTTFAPWQIFTIVTALLLFSFGLVVSTRTTLIAFVAILSFIYLLDVVFNLVVTLKSLHFPPEISIDKSELKSLREEDLPVYTILCPLYKESRVLSHFVSSVSALDYPKNKLEVILLLEEDDQETITSARQLSLPSYFKILIVPHSLPKTKPKACNYGLAHAKGEFVVIYDAEDQPEPDQLKKSYLAFQKSSPRVACLQAKLNYYNPRHNLLTRLFTAEYSLWFDVILPGLQSIKTTIPLGGTSNHFRTSILRKLNGWDSFNVTEDADLGARLFSEGYETAIIESSTLEEANSNLRNWVRQRSRWLKGYMQTYLVHMRRPLTLIKKQGWHALIFQLVIGGKISFILINPLLWIMTISYFVLYEAVGSAIESIYPAPVFYMALVSLLIGNFVALYNYMIGEVKRGHWDLVKHIYLIPLYWLGISYAAAVALVQLFLKPHYWEKTIHGLHLDKVSKATLRAKKIQQMADRAVGIFNSGGVIVISAVIGNFLNFLYTSYLGRHLTLTDFGVINLFGSLFMLTQVPIGALGNAITHKVAFLLGKYQEPVKSVWVNLRRRSLYLSLIATTIYLLTIPLLMPFFNVGSWIPFLLFAPAITVGTLAAVDGGYLGGLLLFTYLALCTILESIIKLVLAVIFVRLGLQEYVYAVIPLSMSSSFILGYYLVKKLKRGKIIPATSSELNFPHKFFRTSVITSLTSLAYTTVDLLLAKHYLSPADAGVYSYLSLAGKMVFLTSGLFSGFIIPYVSRAVGEGREGRRFFRRILLLVTLASLTSFTVFGLFGKITTPILWGERAAGILPYLIPYSLSMVAYSVSSLFVKYHLVRGEYIFAHAGFVVAIAQTVAIVLHHGSVGEIAEAVTVASLFSLTIMLLLDKYYQEAKDLYRAFTDFAGLFRPLPSTPRLGEGKLRILIFNWRDLKHVWAGGAETYLHELGARWVKLGHQVTIFCGSDGKAKRHEIIDGVKVIRRGGFYMVYLWAFLYYLLRLRGRYDVIIDSENGLPFFTPLYAKEKVFLLIHHVHQEVFRSSLVPPFSYLASFLEKRVMPLVYRKTEVITVSPSSKAEILLHQLTKHDPHIVYNGVDLNKCKPGVKSKTPLVLYLGRLTTAKSVHVLLRAASAIISSVPRVKFVIAGDGPARKSLERIVEKMHLTEVITFIGKVSEEEKIRLFQQAWVFVNPSLIEGWGITTIEANACGTPVVASNVAGLRDAVKNPHSGLLVPYGNVDEFARAITSLLKSTRTRTRMSRESVTWAQNFAWDKSAEIGAQILGSNL